ncbi:pilus assembly protein TadG-related protein [Agromyces sp. NPDC127015]|uniref:pilus assembly protein TadG-related protein n=1 Tax=Agromyces sp. NPDC127015 TaxID=3347108 RepID=UPI003654A8BF
MRRLMERLRRERGASAVLIVILLVPLFGMAAIGVDTGMLYYERAQLQNAADSAALAVATKCSVSRCPSSGNTTIASNFANGNAKDATVAIDDQVIDRSARTVRIDVSTLNGDGTTTPYHPFAAVIGVTDDSPVTATATAQWAAGDITLPLAITTCEFDITAAGDGRLHWITYDRNKECKGDPAEPPAKGSFGWLDLMLDDDGNPVGCIADIDADGSVGSDPGNPGIPNIPVCHAAFTESLSGGTVYIPLADYKIGDRPGGKAIWHIKEYAKVTLYSWAFSGTPNLPQVWDETRRDVNNLNCTGSCRGVLVEFQGYVPVGSVPGTDISTTVSLIE